MPSKHDIGLYGKCSSLLDSGYYKEALSLCEAIRDRSLKASILIDGGFPSNKAGKVQEGAVLFEDLLGESTLNFARDSILYNAANGRLSLYQLRKRRRANNHRPNDPDLRAAKRHYRQALGGEDSRGDTFRSRVLVNYGNCLSELGRYVEASEAYLRALAVDPKNGMAAGNLGIELERASRLTGHFRHEYVASANSYLATALGPNTDPRYATPIAIEAFRSTWEWTKEFIDQHRKPLHPPSAPRIRGTKSHRSRYLRFCTNRGLFLNVWVGDPGVTPAIEDDIAFGPITTTAEHGNRIQNMLGVLNEIKESYAAARYLFFLSQNGDSRLDTISKVTTYFDLLDYDVRGIYTGLCKTAYARSFDILDKIARLVNLYFGIGKREDSFWNVFAERRSHGVEKTKDFAARPAICEARNLGLYALSDLCIDYFENAEVDLKTIDRRRNLITHDYLRVRLFSGRSADATETNEVQLDAFSLETQSVLRMAKYAIIYAVSAIAFEERRRAGDHNSPVKPMYYFKRPGERHL